MRIKKSRRKIKKKNKEELLMNEDKCVGKSEIDTIGDKDLYDRRYK